MGKFGGEKGKFRRLHKKRDLWGKSKIVRDPEGEGGADLEGEGKEGDQKRVMNRYGIPHFHKRFREDKGKTRKDLKEKRKTITGEGGGGGGGRGGDVRSLRKGPPSTQPSEGL